MEILKWVLVLVVTVACAREPDRVHEKVDRFCAQRASALRWQTERYVGGEEFIAPYEWSTYWFATLENVYFCADIRRNAAGLEPLTQEFREVIYRAAIAIHAKDRAKAAELLARLVEIFEEINCDPLR